MPRFHAPGRANLIGEHTDHTDGLVLPVAIDRGVTLEVEIGGDAIELTSADAAGTVAVPADGSRAPQAGWGRFVAAVAGELDALGRPAVGMRGELRSDLPQGAGLSSSAALEVVLALGLCHAAGFELPPLELAALGRRAERRAVGVPSGIMDQAASVLGRADHAVLLDCGSLAYRHVPLPSDHVLLVADSGVRRQLETSGYAQRAEELAAALPVLAGRNPATVDVEDLDELLAGLPDVPARRLRHVVTENERVRQTEAALRDGRLEDLGLLFAAGHASLRDDYEVTIPELDRLVQLARGGGATAARMTGGGFGGAIVALVREDRVAAVEAAIRDGYGAEYPQHALRLHRCRVADGARRLSD
ncbi:galactokinase [Egicoccus halophilus]|uniref:Galactokinase n=1 Tax=Egicoccus halophilus TaxID=1670830 RepID=A0A8J3A7M4_9ACTN|nr:galactokinase [Egicoccus halophilus]GGI03524.1 galactokinase [Egicoccus halophilus]